MSRRRYRRRGRSPVLLVAAAFLVLVFLRPALALLHWFPWIAAAAVMVAIGYRCRGQLRHMVTARYAPAPRAVSAPRPAGDARARRNGWAPPARPRTVTVSLSPECAAGDCAVCPGGTCGCPCGHDSRVIVAMNAARADQARPATQPLPPF